jgi:hypothetical protein
MADASIRAETSRISEEITANRGDTREMLNLLKRQQEVHTQIKDGAAGQRSVVGDSVNDASNVTNIAEAAGNVARHMNSGLEKITPAQLLKRVNEKYGLQDGKSSSDSKMLRAAQDWAELGVSLKTTPPMSTMHAALLAAVPEKKVREQRPRDPKPTVQEKETPLTEEEMQQSEEKPQQSITTMIRALENVTKTNDPSSAVDFYDFILACVQHAQPTLDPSADAGLHSAHVMHQIFSQTFLVEAGNAGLTKGEGDQMGIYRIKPQEKYGDDEKNRPKKKQAVLKFDMTSYKLIMKRAASRPRLDLKMAVAAAKAK